MTFHLGGDSLDWALAHIKRLGDTDIFPFPFEFDAISAQWDEIRDFLGKQDLDLWVARPKRVCLTPKGKYSYRVSTQLDPLDSLIYAGLIYEAGSALEASRLPADDQIVLSHRFSPAADGQLFDRNFNWSTFVDIQRERASASSVTHVVTADISDFYSRLYHHRIENALHAASGKSPQARVLFKLIDQFSGGPSYGIPIGPSASRLVADLAIDDVDQYLRAEGTTFCRFSDDYRIFCSSERDAYQRLASLANVLYQNHGLTLQPGKTSIIPTDVFFEHHLSTPESEELRTLSESFVALASFLGLGSIYDQIEYDDLTPGQKEAVRKLNLRGLLESQLKASEFDVGLVKFILRRLGQLNDSSVAIDVLEQIHRLYPVISDVIEYLAALRDVPWDLRAEVGERVMWLIDASIVGHLPYHRCWFLSLYASGEWGQEDRFVPMYNGTPESFTRRKCVLAMGRTKQFFWFRAGRDSALDLEPWQRRAFLAGSSCLPADERKYWYNSLKGRIDELEQAVVRWANESPLS